MAMTAEIDELLSVTTLPAYISSLRLFPDGATLSASEINGGNLNYAFRVTVQSCGTELQSVFVKQTPGFVKVLGPAASISNKRLLTERRAYEEWAALAGTASFLPQILHFDNLRMILVMEFLSAHILVLSS